MYPGRTLLDHTLHMYCFNSQYLLISEHTPCLSFIVWVASLTLQATDPEGSGGWHMALPGKGNKIDFVGGWGGIGIAGIR